MAMIDPRNCEDTNSKVEKLIEELGPKRYSHVDLEKFTSNFAESNILGSGAHGVVYKGQLPNGVQVAVKRLEHKDVVEETFMAEVSTISSTNHRNLIKLKGCCFEPNMRALVYEYMENGSLDKILYKRGSSIEWKKFYGIAIEIAKGLDYLHDGFDGQIIHYDIKAENVLLDKNLSAKITDFGIAKLLEMNVSHVPLTRTRGTPGYNAPETWMPESQVTYKCDVYSFGMMLFELLGKRNNGVGGNWFPGQVWEKFERGQLELELNYIGITEVNIENAKLLSMVALWCVQFKPENRPTMREVVSMLEKKIHVKRPPNPFPFWQFSKSSMPSQEGISKDDLQSFYGIDGRSIQDAESFLFSLEGNIPRSTDIVSTENKSQVTFLPSTVEEGVEANVTLSAFSVGVVNPDGGLDTFANVQKRPGKLNYSNGDSYEGTWENGLRHGQGRFVWAYGDVYIGEWKNDVREGHGKITYQNGNCYEGTFRNSEKDGQGRFVWRDGDEYSGEWKNNDRDGHGKFTHYKSGDCYKGTYRNSKKDGHGRYVWANGDEYSGEWKNDDLEGQGRFVWANGCIYNGKWKNNVREGQGRYVWPDGDEYNGEWKNDVREGLGRITYKTGNYYEGVFRNSVRDGQGRLVWPNGDEYRGEWKNGVREGQGRITYKNGHYYEGMFRNSVRDGQGRLVWEDGDEYSGEWKNDVREGLGKFTYKSGSYYEGMYRNSERDGQGRYVGEDGDEYNGEWKNGVREGHGKYTYKNGDIWEGTFENDSAVKGRFTYRKLRFLRRFVDRLI